MKERHHDDGPTPNSIILDASSWIWRIFGSRKSTKPKNKTKTNEKTKNQKKNNLIHPQNFMLKYLQILTESSVYNLYFCLSVCLVYLCLSIEIAELNFYSAGVQLSATTTTAIRNKEDIRERERERERFGNEFPS